MKNVMLWAAKRIRRHIPAMTLAHMGQALLDECTSALGLCDVQLEVSEGHILVKKR